MLVDAFVIYVLLMVEKIYCSRFHVEVSDTWFFHVQVTCFFFHVPIEVKPIRGFFTEKFCETFKEEEVEVEVSSFLFCTWILWLFTLIYHQINRETVIRDLLK